MHTVCLMGPPGSGKTTMACLTCVNKPIHVIDIDRKISSMHSLKPSITKGDITLIEIRERLMEGSLVDRVKQQAGNVKPTMQPQGWIRFAQAIENLCKTDDFNACNTLLIDSWSMASDHLIRLILYHNTTKGAAATFSPREWGAFLQMEKEAITVVIDVAKSFNKDLIVTVHERISEIPGEQTKVLRDATGDRQFVGQMDMKISPSIQGQFGLEMARYFEEVYGLNIKIENNKPKWICKVKPDGKRDLRTSFNVGEQVEFEPDFRKIWRQ